jgi:hypothetical protein
MKLVRRVPPRAELAAAVAVLASAAGAQAPYRPCSTDRRSEGHLHMFDLGAYRSRSRGAYLVRLRGRCRECRNGSAWPRRLEKPILVLLDHRPERLTPLRLTGSVDVVLFLQDAHRQVVLIEH